MIFFPRSDAENRILIGWIERRVPDAAPLGDARTIGVIRDARIVAAVAYNNYREGSSIDVTLAADSPAWATRQAIATMLAYPFVQLEVRRVSALTRNSNRRARKLLEGLGFLREGTMAAAFADGSGALYGMTRRWFLRSKWHGQESTVAATGA